ncbi:HIRAN domain-containing protein [Sporomusa acidovorans]|uniref:HIRAN domain-containing protein n=1 Tax=Sporomusa acidovorans (strain ATCC 49682 / DSM 3132 / Mol) TaxID=1123286 RepID=A0ABZ3JBP4_SPOA4|nr:HIRAN domain-containing protein [Sporomusa acidovorans]OZC16994.1 hypothetical protein SPACI_39650 [Sporomusa acidovorans DSM 3132]SDF33574.1 HIRAN domain-containing protein [Sporomusa acidovorans]
METHYIAITGCRHYYGSKPLKVGLPVQLIKEPDNEYDAEAIAVHVMPLGKVGYVANSTHTVPRGCYSAGRIYDTIKNYAYGIIRFVFQDTAIVELLQNKELYIEIKMEVHEDTSLKYRQPRF